MTVVGLSRTLVFFGAGGGGINSSSLVESRRFAFGACVFGSGRLRQPSVGWESVSPWWRRSVGVVVYAFNFSKVGGQLEVGSVRPANDQSPRSRLPYCG